MTDFTKPKNTEDALKKGKKRFRTLSEATFKEMVIYADNVVLEANQAALEQTGLQPRGSDRTRTIGAFTCNLQEVIERHGQV